MHLEYRVGRGIAFIGLLCILAATLTSAPGASDIGPRYPSWCLVCGDWGGVDVTLNVILFLPFAIGLRLMGMRKRYVVAVCFALSVFVESMQIWVVLGRDASLSDVLTNTTGGAVGAVVASYARTLVLPRPSAALGLAAAWSGVWLAILLGSAWLMQPAPPRGELKIGWRPYVYGYGVFTGRVDAVTSGGVPLEPDTVADDPALRRRLATGTVDFQIDATVGRQKGWAPIVAVQGRADLLAAVYEGGDHIFFELPTNAGRLHLRGPTVRLDHGRPREPGTPVHLIAGARHQTRWIASFYGGMRHSRELPMSPSFGWVLVLPFNYGLGPEAHLLTGLWLAGLLLPLGYWVRWIWTTRPRWHLAAGVGAVLAAGLGLTPWIMGYPPVHRSEWVAGLVGLALGWAVASRVTYLAGRCVSPSTSESFSS